MIGGGDVTSSAAWGKLVVRVLEKVRSAGLGDGMMVEGGELRTFGLSYMAHQSFVEIFGSGALSG